MAQPEVLERLVLDGNGHTSTFTLFQNSLRIQRDARNGPNFQLETDLRNVLWAHLSDDRKLAISFLVKKRNKRGHLYLLNVGGPVRHNEVEETAEFVEALMKEAYRGIKTKRRLLLLINPHSGPGKARSIYKKKIEPVFRAAQTRVDVIYTTHHGHATEVARTLELGKYDAIVTMSGDGLVYEVLNGLAEHNKSPLEALHTPITPIPTGSGNGLALNLLGLKEGTDVSVAAVNAIKGKPMAIDLFSVTQDGKRTLSFFSQCIGLMAELDLWTEHLRFLGSNRFVYGYLRGVIQKKSCPIKVYIKVGESDKHVMYNNFKKVREAALSKSSSFVPANGDTNEHIEANGDAQNNDTSSSSNSSTSLPPLKYIDEDHTKDDGWITFDRPVCYFYGGKGPLVSVDLMQFPVSVPNDGYIDIAIREVVSRGAMLSAMNGAETGKTYWKDSVHYFKAKAYRVEPHSHDSCLSIDGEKYPFKPYDLEVHPGLGTLLSMYGTYNTDIDAPM